MKKPFLYPFIAFLVLCTTMSTTAQAASKIEWSRDKQLAIAAIGINVPYACYLIRSNNATQYLKNRLFYKGNTAESLLNHSLNVVSYVALGSEIPAKYLLLTGAIFVGLQTSTYTFFDAHGVSLVWSGLTGMLLHRLCIQKEVKSHLLLATLLNSTALIYYAYKAPAITTIAHIGGVAAGIGISFCIPYKDTL